MTEPQYEMIEARLEQFIAATARENDSNIDPLPLVDSVELILDRFYPEWRAAVFANVRTRWDKHRQFAIRCLSRLREREVTAVMMGSSGPRLAADALHPWVWDAAKAAWEGGNFTDSVDAAARNVNARLRRKAKRPDLNEGQLVQQAFSLDPPQSDRVRLRIPLSDVSDDTRKSIHRGIINFGQGCFAAIRNPVAHESEDAYSMTEREALESLAALSLLALWIERAEVAEAC